MLEEQTEVIDAEDPRDRAHPTPPGLEAVRSLFPDLEVLELIGAGGMGAVYKARQPALDRWVALKLLPDHADESGFAQRFNREAKALARLNHANIVAVYEFGQRQGRHFFIMEYIDGTNLRQLEKNKRLSPREALQIVPQICDALQYAHDEGVVHRDIKPENVLIDRKGKVKIADFGLAKIMNLDEGSHRLTLDGQVMGTPHYMAPEQVESPGSVDHRADIFSLGVVFYEMLTGELPIGKFVPPSRKVSMDVRLDEVVLRALENDPTLRFQRVNDVKTNVESIASTQPAPNPVPEGDRAQTASTKRYLYWAGMPVVREQDGEREVTLAGTLGAVAVVFATLTVAFLCVRFMTGEEVDRFTLRFCEILGLLTVIFGIRRTLHQPASQSSTGADHTPTLSTKRPELFRTAALVGAIFLVTTAWGLAYRPWISPALQHFISGRSPHVASIDSATGVLQARSKNGLTAEVLAISNPYPGPDSWWRPEGRPIDALPFQIHQLPPAPQDPTRNILLRLKNLPEGSSGPHIQVLTPGIKSRSRNDVFLNGTRAPGLWLIQAETPSNISHIALKAGIDHGPWELAATHSPAKQSSIQRVVPSFPESKAFVHQVSDTQKGCQVTVGTQNIPANCVLSVVAIDPNGDERPYHVSSGSPWASEHVEMWTYEFNDLKLDQVDEFRSAVRPIEWFVFKKIPLHPTQSVGPSMPPLFEPMVELTGELFDFDQPAREHSPLLPEPDPSKPDDPNPFKDLGEEIASFFERGFDALADTGALRLFGVTLSVMDAEDWENAIPQDVWSHLSESQSKPDRILPLESPSAHRVFAYQTRNRTIGLLQVVRIREDAPEATLRFKRIRTAHFH